MRGAERPSIRIGLRSADRPLIIGRTILTDPVAVFASAAMARLYPPAISHVVGAALSDRLANALVAATVIMLAACAYSIWSYW